MPTLTVSPRLYLRVVQMAFASLYLIIITGSLVRLTGSGLGCADWPRCSETKFVDVSNSHAAIEQVNRLFTGVVAASVILAVMLSLRLRPKRRDLVGMSFGLVLGVLVQVILGGLVVLTGLNPFFNIAHFLVSIFLITNAYLLLQHAKIVKTSENVLPRQDPALTNRKVILLIRSVLIMIGLAIVTGTVVTGSGPHAGDENAQRIDLAINLVEGKDRTMTIRFTKKGDAQVHIEQSTKQQSLTHDKQKVRLLDPNDQFLREVGISDAQGRIKPTKHDKYLQVEEFLRILVPALNSAIDAGHITTTKDKPLSIVDHGCGNAYLTFAAHQYLQSISMNVQIIGIDVREQSRTRNTDIARRLEISDSISFRAEKISETDIQPADITIALHACDTATDEAIAWAIKNNSKLLVIAPCCHHDLQTQLVDSPEPWSMITKHGILKERFADILTDALRAQILRIKGYRTEIIEFVGDEHTPRNLIIRAIKTGAKPDPGDIERYKELVTIWAVTPALSTMLGLAF